MYRVTNKALQQNDLSIDCGIKLIAGLRSTLQEIADMDFEQNLQEVQSLAEEIGVEKGLFNKRIRRVEIMEIDGTLDEHYLGGNFTAEKLFRTQIFSVLNTL